MSLARIFFKHWQVGRRPLLLAGHGRSGTTWTGNILSKAKNVLYYEEPCNPKIRGISDFETWFEYLQTGAEDPTFKTIFDSVFRGMPHPGQRWPTTASRRLVPGYKIVVKEIASLLSVEWVYQRYEPDILLMVRHPCGVVLSEINKATPVERSLKALLSQKRLFDDHLAPFRSLIETAVGPYEILGVIWAARHRVLANILQKHHSWPIIYYEDLCLNPLEEFQKVFRRFNLPWSNAIKSHIISSSTVNKNGTYSTSRVSHKQIDKWKKSMSQEQIKAVKRFVLPFNLPFYKAKECWEY